MLHSFFYINLSGLIITLTGKIDTEETKKNKIQIPVRCYRKIIHSFIHDNERERKNPCSSHALFFFFFFFIHLFLN